MKLIQRSVFQAHLPEADFADGRVAVRVRNTVPTIGEGTGDELLDAAVEAAAGMASFKPRQRVAGVAVEFVDESGVIYAAAAAIVPTGTPVTLDEVQVTRTIRIPIALQSSVEAGSAD